MEDERDAIYKYQPLWGKWYIEMPIGKGSYGSVYKISREDMSKKYTSAIKIITIPSDEQRKEAEASFGYDDETLALYFEDIAKNIVNKIDILYSLSGTTNILNYQDHEVIKNKNGIGWDILIRMEYVTSLRNYIREHKMSEEEVIHLGIDICTALETCSKKGIVHGNIKDENIFINEDGIFKLGDFGIANELGKSVRASLVREMPLYMAPEIYKVEKYNLAFDIYSLGIMLYKLLNNNRMPFMPSYPNRVKYSDIEEALEKRMRGEQLPLPSNAKNKLGEIVLKACAYESNNRYSSPTEMKKELQKFLQTLNKADLSEQHSAQIINNEKEIRINQDIEQEETKIGTITVFDELNEGKGSITSVENKDIKPQKELSGTVGIDDGMPKPSDFNIQKQFSKEDADNQILKDKKRKTIGCLVIFIIAIAMILLLVLYGNGRKNVASSEEENNQISPEQTFNNIISNEKKTNSNISEIIIDDTIYNNIILTWDGEANHILNDANLWKAIYLIIDREYIANYILGENSNAILPDTSQYNPEEAVYIIENSSYNGEEIIFIYNDNVENFTYIAQLMKSMFQEIGLNVIIIEYFDDEQFNLRRASGNYDLVLTISDDNNYNSIENINTNIDSANSNENTIYFLQDGTYTFDIGDLYWVTDLNNSKSVYPVEGGYMLTVNILENIEVTRDEFNRVNAGDKISKKIGDGLVEIWEIDSVNGWQGIECIDVAVEWVPGQKDEKIVFQMGIAGDGVTYIYIPEEAEIGTVWAEHEVHYYTGQVAQFYISSQTNVLLPDLIYGNNVEKNFGSYLATGGATEHEGRYADNYIVTVSNGEIIEMSTFFYP